MNSSNIEIRRINTTPTPTTDLNLNKNTVPLASTGATKLTFSIVGTTNNNKNTTVPNNNSVPSNTTPTTTATTATPSTTSTGPSNNKVSITRDVTRSVSATTLGNNKFHHPQQCQCEIQYLAIVPSWGYLSMCLRLLPTVCLMYLLLVLIKLPPISPNVYKIIFNPNTNKC